jgi:hypothetical protein
VPVPCFLLFLCFGNATQKYSRNWTKQKPDVQIFHGASRRPKRRRIRARGRPHNRAARPRAGPRLLVVWAPWSTSDAAPSPIRTPRREKPKDPDHFSRTHRDPPPPSTQRSGGSRSSSRHPTREGNRHQRSSSSPCLPLMRWVSSLPCTMGP